MATSTAEKRVDFKPLYKGEPLELSFTEVIDPVTGTNFTSLSGVDMKFSVKTEVSDTDANAIAVVRETDPGFTIDGADAFSVRLLSNTDSESLTPGKSYKFDGWLIDSNGVKRAFNFGTDLDPVYVGYVCVLDSVTDTVD